MSNRPQLVHTARQMFETRLAKYNDPHNLEWDFDDITDKWERHAFSAHGMLREEIDEALQEVREVLLDLLYLSERVGEADTVNRARVLMERLKL